VSAAPDDDDEDLLFWLHFCFASSRDLDVWKGPPGKVQVSLDVLTNDGLGVVAGHVVPLDAVAIEVVQHCQASLLALATVGLALAGSASVRPAIVAIGWEKSGLVG